MTVQDIDRGTFATAWQDWHVRHESALADPHGFLAITGIHWLTDEPERYPGAPGVWSTSADGVTVELAPEEELAVEGVAIHGRYSFGVIPERGGINATFGNAVVEVAKRGGHHIIRPRHPEHSLRARFAGTPAYAPDPRWSVAGRFVAFDQPRPITVGASVEGLQHVYESRGLVEFEVDGQPLRLTAFNGSAPGRLFILFTDATSGVTTYAANRSLQVDVPDADGNVTIDFNRATNLPCAYTDFATCPLPPRENRLPIAVEAGEKTPFERG